MNKKTTIILFSSLALLTIAAIVFFYLQHQQAEDTYDTVATENTANATRALYYYSGDNGNGYLLKGMLLDKTAESEYAQLPDTLYFPKFGEALYCTTCSVDMPVEEQVTTEDTAGKNKYEIAQMEVDKAVKKATDQAMLKQYKTKRHYSPFTKKLSELNLSSADKSPYSKAFLAYIKMADAGKVAYPIFGTVSMGSVVSEFEFAERFHHQFDDKTTGEIPYIIKEKIMDFLDTDEGGYYTLARKDSRWYPNLVVQGNFRYRSGKDVAIILQPKNDYDSYKEKLIIFSAKNAAETYILYNETNYDKTLLELVPAGKSSADSDSAFYKESEEPDAIATDDCLRIKHEGRADVVLVYNSEFDKMVTYIQKPKSELEIKTDNDE